MIKKRSNVAGRGATTAEGMAELLDRPTPGTMTEADLMLLLNGRSFGTEMKDTERFEQNVPDFLGPIVGELRASSALLGLDAPASYDAILSAYQHDVMFLQRRLDDLERLAKGAVRSSMKRMGEESGALSFNEQWGFVKRHIPSLADAPLIDLSAERAALPATQLLTELKAEVDAGINSMMKRFCLWLDLLVGREYIGLVRFTAPTVGHYYYYRPYVVEKEVLVDHRVETAVDTSVPYGQQTTYRIIDGVRTKVTESIERHDHHIVRAKSEPLIDYTGRIPTRLVEFLDAVPEWLVPHLRVVSGVITKEVVRRRVVREEETYEERVISTYKGSPAIALGGYSLDGWSADNLRDETSGFSRKQKVYVGEKKKDRRRDIRLVILLLLVFGIVGGGVTFCVHSSNVTQAENYHAYVTNHGVDKEIFTITKSEPVTLPRGEALYYQGYGTNRYQPSVIFGIGSEALRKLNGANKADKPDRFVFEFDVKQERAADTYYQTFDLGPMMGILARMNVLYADNNEVRFTLDYYVK